MAFVVLWALKTLRRAAPPVFGASAPFVTQSDAVRCVRMPRCGPDFNCARASASAGMASAELLRAGVAGR